MPVPFCCNFNQSRGFDSRPTKRPRLVNPDPGQSVPSSSKVPTEKSQIPTKAAKKTKKSRDEDKASLETEFMKVMAPRTTKPRTLAALNEGKEGVAPAPEEAPDQGAAPAEEGLSDLEWMRRRMKSSALDEETEGLVEDQKVFEQSDEEGEKKDEENHEAEVVTDDVSFSTVLLHCIDGCSLSLCCQLKKKLQEILSWLLAVYSFAISRTHARNLI